MKAQEFKALEVKATGLANAMLPGSIEDLTRDKDLTQRQQWRIDRLIDFAKLMYRNRYGVDWTRRL